MHIRIPFIFLITALVTSGFSQPATDRILLLDLEHSLPIVGAIFTYGDQQGISDEQGMITFRRTLSDSMKLSHLNYGSWSWSAAELDFHLKEGIYYKRRTVINLYPVTIIAVKPQNKALAERVGIDYPERMEHDGASILNQVPAFNSIRKGGNYGFDPVFRGFKYDQLNIVLNGAQSATAACPNRMDPPTSQMAPNMMDRIEVLKGPHALRYGTGFGATVNFVPTKLRFSPSPQVYGRASTGYESNGNIARGETQVGLSGAMYDLSVFGSWSQGNDYTAGNGDEVQADFTRGSFGINLGVKLTDNQQLRLSTTYNRARDADFPALPMDLRDDDTWMFNLRHDIQINNRQLESWNTTLFGSFVDHLMDNRLKPLDPRTLNAETAATTYNFGGRTESIWQLGKGRLFAGADLRVEGAEGTRLRAFLTGPNAGNTVRDNAWQDGQIRKSGFFGEYHLTTSLFRYAFSGRLEINEATIKDLSEEFGALHPDTEITQINPNVSVGIMKTLSADWEVGLWLGRAQRSGGLTERFINFFPVGQDPFEMLGDPQLSPEVNNQVDLTFAWEQSQTVIGIDLFASYLQDFISSVIDPTIDPRLSMSPGVRRFINIDEAFKTGFELSWSQALFAGLQQQLAVAYTYGQDLERDEPLPEIAPLDLRYVLTGSYFEQRLRPQATFRYVVEQSRISEEFGETATPSFALVDLKVGYDMTTVFSINIGVNNAFDKNYFEHLNRSVRGTMDPIFAPGRNWFANVSYRF